MKIVVSSRIELCRTCQDSHKEQDKSSISFIFKFPTDWAACGLARIIFNYANVLFVFVFFCDTSKALENLTFILNKVLFCRMFVLLL